MDKRKLTEQFWEYCANQQLIQSISADSLPRYNNASSLTHQLMDDVAYLFHLEENLFWDYINYDTQHTVSDLEMKFEQKMQQLKKLLETATLFMHHKLKVSSQEVNHCLV